MSRKLKLTATGAALALLGADYAAAQGIEEVVVTARKKEETLQSVPVAVSALSGEALAEQGIRTPLDLGRSVPSLRALPHPSSQSIVVFQLRGQSASDVLSTVDQAVGMYVDGVYIARPRGLNGAFMDLERIEVLKGPQGTLYGRNTTGGAVNLISRNADYDGYHGYAGIDVGSENLVAGRAAVNVPILQDRLAMRLAYQGTYRDGFGKSAVTGQSLGQDRGQNFFRGSITADPWENVNVVVKGEYYRSKEGGQLQVARHITPTGIAVFQAATEVGGLTPLGLGRFFGAIPGGPLPADLAAFGAGLAALQNFTRLGAQDFFTNYYEKVQHDEFEGYTIGGTITVDLSDNVQVKSITGYRAFTNEQVFDLDGTPFRILQVGVGHFPDNPIVLGLPGLPAAPFQSDAGPEQDATFFSQEVNLSGSAFDGRLSWLGGVYYSKEKGSDTQHAQAFPAVLANTFIHDGAEIGNTSWSLFSQNDFKITDTVSFTFGGRYTEEDKSLLSHSRNFNFNNGTILSCLTGVPIPPGTTTPSSCTTYNAATFTGFSYLGSLNWQVTPDILLYVKTAEGFRGGAFQLRSPTLAPAGPETATDVELGMKAEWLDGKLRTNVAMFRTEYANKQESIIITQAGGNSATVIQNAADAESRGIEAEITARPIDGLTLGATVAYFEGEYGAFTGALPVQGGTPVDASGEDFSAPPWTYSLRANYERPFWMGSLAGTIDWSWTAGAEPSARLINPALPAALVDEFVAACNTGSCVNGRASLGLLNLRLDWKVEQYDATVSFFMTNATDEHYMIPGPDASNLGGLQAGIVGEPRMWGFSLRKNFGE
ncbi:MAG: TonB-dependent receptor [Gammaproteobacteria bacterium]